MPDINNYLGGKAIDPAPRAAIQWARIQEKPTSIRIRREGSSTSLPAQTVRIEYSQSINEQQSSGGLASIREVIVFGIRDHPLLPDTDIQRGDRFTYEGTQCRVIDILFSIGVVQARAEANA